MIRQVIAIGLLIGATSACTSDGPDYERPEFQPTRIVERMEGVEETPDFATGAKVMWQEEGNVIFANIVTLAGNSRPEACLKAASIEAKTEMLKYIKENLTTSGQLNEASAEEDPAYESLTAFLSQGQISGAGIVGRYYDRREISDATGERVLKLRCAVKLAVKKTQLAKQLREATTNAPQGNPEIREKLLDAQQQFISGLGT